MLADMHLASAAAEAKLQLYSYTSLTIVCKLNEGFLVDVAAPWGLFQTTRCNSSVIGHHCNSSYVHSSLGLRQLSQVEIGEEVERKAWEQGYSCVKQHKLCIINFIQVLALQSEKVCTSGL